MRCDQVQERLSEYLENLLDAESHTSVHDHLSSCPHCQAEVQNLAQTRKAVSDLPSVEPPPGFSQKVMARIREEAERPNLWQRLFLPLRIKIPVHAMTILLMGGLAIYLYQVNKPVQTEVAKLAPSEPNPTPDIGLYSQPPAFPSSPSLEQRKAQKDGVISKTPDRREDLKREDRLMERGTGILKPDKEAEVKGLGKSSNKEVPAADAPRAPAPPPVQAAYKLIFIPNDPTEKGLTRKVEELIKKMGGQSVQTEEVTPKSKPGLAIEPQQDSPLKPQTVWLIIPKGRYGQLKTELASLGKIEESSIAPEIPAGSMAVPKASTESSPSLQIELILQLSEEQK